MLRYILALHGTFAAVRYILHSNSVEIYEAGEIHLCSLWWIDVLLCLWGNISTTSRHIIATLCKAPSNAVKIWWNEITQ